MTAAKRKDTTIIKSPTRVCQILFQALEIFFGSPPPPIKSNPARIKFISEKSPPATNTSLRSELAKATTPVSFHVASMAGVIKGAGEIHPIPSIQAASSVPRIIS